VFIGLKVLVSKKKTDYDYFKDVSENFSSDGGF